MQASTLALSRVSTEDMRLALVTKHDIPGSELVRVSG